MIPKSGINAIADRLVIASGIKLVTHRVMQSKKRQNARQPSSVSPSGGES